MKKIKGILVFLFFIALVACSSTQTSKVTENTLNSNYSSQRASQLQKYDSYKVPKSNPIIKNSSSISCNVTKKKVSKNKKISEEDRELQNIVDSALEYYNLSQDLWNQGKAEEALEALDQAYELLLQIDEDSELAQSKENLRFVIAKRILEIYASRYTATNGLYSEIPLVLNRYVEAEIKRFQTCERSFFLNAYKRSGRYRPMILAKLKEAGLPEELSWLPLIESGFKVNALSPARALGLWQFIPSTGYKFGLKRNYWIDERMDPEKSTEAAIAYLTELHKIFGDWTTVLAAYNCGEARVLRVIKRQKINYLDNFWDLYERLPRETARYVPRFLAVLHILNDPAKYGFDKLPTPDPPLEYETVKVDKQYSLKTIAKALGISDKLLADYNPELRYRITPANYDLKVPKGKGPELVALLEKGSIKPWVPKKTYYVYHRLRRGETLSHLARRYKTSVVAIMRANGISNPRRLRAGQRLKIPVGKKYVAYSSHKNKNQKIVTYVVKPGDSLWRIARKFKTSTKKIMKTNNLKTHRLQVGQVLKIPVKVSSS
ncbi:lytic transglycosylase domain-containing protein [Thermodesulfatator autotrophicus]|uniref:Lytic transglycosylase n=1 Tax=Thermodesulfatator autotrophicus TaxID=1795632 RepID=A0A177E6G3_9BACT|nr:lytic transglycosylase domain-containing protein [Thermodesulfatator autotrophicus]OAG27534.1 lytic transglycosylase [Thermodesulfatator autotrophicus]